MQQTEYQSTLFIQTLFLTTNYFTEIYFNINFLETGDRLCIWVFPGIFVRGVGEVQVHLAEKSSAVICFFSPQLIIILQREVQWFYFKES